MTDSEMPGGLPDEGMVADDSDGMVATDPPAERPRRAPLPKLPLTPLGMAAAFIEHRHAIVKVDEGSLRDLLNSGRHGYMLRTEVEGLPAEAIVTGVHHSFQESCFMVRFTHPDLPSVQAGCVLPELQGTVETIDPWRENEGPEDADDLNPAPQAAGDAPEGAE